MFIFVRFKTIVMIKGKNDNTLGNFFGQLLSVLKCVLYCTLYKRSTEDVQFM